MDDSDVISFLLQTEIIPLCLRIMDNGSELSKTVATFIIQKILLDDMGLNYICATYERFSTVSSVLSKMVAERPSGRLLKHIVRCYLRLSENPRAKDALRGCLPTQLRDNTFKDVFTDDPTTKRWVAHLLSNVGTESTATG
jgi:CCR4-NOT transcription complex subunit 9